MQKLSRASDSLDLGLVLQMLAWFQPFIVKLAAADDLHLQTLHMFYTGLTTTIVIKVTQFKTMHT